MSDWLQELTNATAEAMERQLGLYGRVDFDQAYDCIFPKLNIPPDAKKAYRSGVKKAIRQMGLLEKKKKTIRKKQSAESGYSRMAQKCQGRDWASRGGYDGN
jgi:hypothetical protein